MHLWHWAGSGGALGPEWTGWTPRDRHFAWQAWHLWHWAGSGGALGPERGGRRGFLRGRRGKLVTWTCTLRGRRGTW